MAVLALRPDRLGDFILSTPALQALERELGSSVRLTLVVGERNGALARFFFPRAEVLVFRKFFLSRLILFLRLRMRHFDLVLDFHSYPFSTTSAILALCSGSPFRVGFWDRKESNRLSRRVFNLGVPSPPENLHEMEKSFLLLKPLRLSHPKSKEAILKIPDVPAGIASRVKAFYDRIGVGPLTVLLAIHPTLQKEDNRWSLEKYVELSRKMASFSKFKMVVVHGLGEEDHLQRFKGLATEIPNLFELPDNDVFFILEAAKRFNLLVCNDSGLMHLVALMTRVLAIFGPSDPERWGPLKAGNLRPKILRSRDHCCDSVRVSMVTEEIEKMVRRPRSLLHR
jgi:ADP-heptose:LPS heptosyltransferase